jgi:hypothetical protein
MDRFPSVIEPGVYHKWYPAIFPNPNSSLCALDQGVFEFNGSVREKLDPLQRGI